MTNKHNLITSNMDLASNMAKKRKRSVNNTICLDELESAAFMGLVDAANKYDSDKVPFKSYAMIRINGEMTNYIREIGWGTRGNPVRTCPVDDNMRCTKNSFIDDFFQILPEQVRQIFEWYYREDMTLKEIGEKINVTESMVSKLMSKYKAELLEHKEEILKEYQLS